MFTICKILIKKRKKKKRESEKELLLIMIFFSCVCMSLLNMSRGTFIAQKVKRKLPLLSISLSFSLPITNIWIAHLYLKTILSIFNSKSTAVAGCHYQSLLAPRNVFMRCHLSDDELVSYAPCVSVYMTRKGRSRFLVS